MPQHSDLSPQSLLMETTWTMAWLNRLLRRADECEKAGLPSLHQVFIADRSPFSSVFYSKRGGALLEPVIRAQIEELKTHAQIEIYTVYLKVEPERLWRRIVARLEREPQRAAYSENERAWMDKTVAFYEGFAWDVTLANNDPDISRVMDEVVAKIAGRSKLFRRAIRDAYDAFEADVDLDVLEARI